VKRDTVFKRAYNDALDFLATYGHSTLLPSEVALARQLGVSRTTIRKVLGMLEEQGAIVAEADGRRVSDINQSALRFPESETISMSDQVEKRFMEWMLRDSACPGTVINERELAREFGVATTGIREFLNRFQHYGLIEKRPNAGWLFKGFTIEFALELLQIREMFELRSARAFSALSKHSPLWWQIDTLRQEHEQLLREVDSRYQDFSDLDNRFHRLINSASPNRFIDGFYDLISLIFHYHYQWNKQDERKRNENAILEHLDYIDALKSKNASTIEQACRTHLSSAKQTLISAILGESTGVS
jgi:DNA-binding GntR family transcriptional regulator